MIERARRTLNLREYFVLPFRRLWAICGDDEVYFNLVKNQDTKANQELRRFKGFK